MVWRKLSGEEIEIPILQQVENILIAEAAKGVKIKVCIGTDSQQKNADTEFATALVFLREGAGGFMYMKHQILHQLLGIKERMILEVSKSIEIAYELCELLTKYNVDMEVHADINTNPNFQSNVALRDAMGYITGMGFAFKAKPDAFASSCCADKMVHLTI
jgi:uncharacterized protein